MAAAATVAQLTTAEGLGHHRRDTGWLSRV